MDFIDKTPRQMDEEKIKNVINYKEHLAKALVKYDYVFPGELVNFFDDEIHWDKIVEVILDSITALQKEEAYFKKTDHLHIDFKGK